MSSKPTEELDNLASQPDKADVVAPDAAATDVIEDSSKNTPSPEALEVSETPDAPEAPTPDPTAELVADLQRTRADFENFRKQVDLQKSQAVALAKEATVGKFLPLIDDFSRAIATYPEQLSALSKSFDKLLTSLDLAIIPSEAGTEFNPDLHEAISMEDGEGETEVIAETLRPGYTYSGSVIRPAMVKVTKS